MIDRTRKNCFDCDRVIAWDSIRCRSCNTKLRWKNGGLSDSLFSREQRSRAGILGAKKRWEGHIVVLKYTQGNKKPDLTDKERREHKRFWNQRYKVRKKNALGSHTLEDWLLLKAFYGNICLCCKRTEPEIKLSEDHIIPLSKGGSDFIDNIQPLCTRCNTSKYTKTINYMQLKGGDLLA